MCVCVYIYVYMCVYSLFVCIVSLMCQPLLNPVYRYPYSNSYCKYYYSCLHLHSGSLRNREAVSQLESDKVRR